MLTDPQLSERDGVYEALRNRATYATSGIRAHLGWTVTDGVDTWRMGTEIAGGTRRAAALGVQRSCTGPALPAGQNPFQIIANHREAVWSSPVWVDGEPADGP